MSPTTAVPAAKSFRLDLMILGLLQRDEAYTAEGLAAICGADVIKTAGWLELFNREGLAQKSMATSNTHPPQVLRCTYTGIPGRVQEAMTARLARKS